MLSRLKARIRRRKKQVFEDVACKNCQTVFTGRYCPNCGQSFKDYDRPFSFLLFNFMFDFFAFDERFFKTIGLLFIRPGLLTKEYFAGRRVRYAPPFRVFIFLSFVTLSFNHLKDLFYSNIEEICRPFLSSCKVNQDVSPNGRGDTLTFTMYHKLHQSSLTSCCV